jgi:hypothetical protein
MLVTQNTFLTTDMSVDQSHDEKVDSRLSVPCQSRISTVRSVRRMCVNGTN